MAVFGSLCQSGVMANRGKLPGERRLMWARFASAQLWSFETMARSRLSPSEDLLS
jgi:hypothetical protein